MIKIYGERTLLPEMLPVKNKGAAEAPHWTENGHKTLCGLGIDDMVLITGAHLPPVEEHCCRCTRHRRILLVLRGKKA